MWGEIAALCAQAHGLSMLFEVRTESWQPSENRQLAELGRTAAQMAFALTVI